MMNKSRVFPPPQNQTKFELSSSDIFNSFLMCIVFVRLIVSRLSSHQPALDPSTAHTRPIGGAAIGPEAADFFGPNDPLPGEPGFGEAKARRARAICRCQSQSLTAKNRTIANIFRNHFASYLHHTQHFLFSRVSSISFISISRNSREKHCLNPPMFPRLLVCPALYVPNGCPKSSRAPTRRPR